MMRSPKTTNWLQRNSLVLAGMGLCLFSSGIDGAFMAKLMPVGWGFLGLGLNAVADVVSFLLTHWFGVFQQDGKRTKRRRLSWFLLPAEGVACFYSWYISYWQLMLVLPGVLPMLDAGGTHKVALVIGGFVPLHLAFLGWAHAIQVGKLEVAHVESTARTAITQVAEPMQIAEIVAAPSEHSGNGNRYTCSYCSKEFGSKQAVGAHLRWCAVYQEQQELACVQP